MHPLEKIINENPQQIIHKALYVALGIRLDACTKIQQEFFHKIYPKELKDFTQEEFKNAIDLCNRTIRKNLANPERLEK